jgi:ATP-binding cassette subfamily B protein
VASIAAALIIWYGGGWVQQGTLTLGALVAFLQYAQRFFRPISDMSEKFNILQASMASSERIFKLLDEPVHITSPSRAGLPGAGLPTSPTTEAGPATISFENVWFAYNGDDWVLKDVSFRVEPGERIGIVGATGAGKTTIINLLMRFYDVTRGRVLVDGVDIRSRDLHELRSQFSLVLQDVHLFSGTIAGNIRLGNPTIDNERIRQAARSVHADRFIDLLPAGLESPVAERGATLSVGQKQLLSFARALAFDPRILVLDEATSSVDTETELLIRDALHVLMAGRTTIAIAHRLSTIQDMDRILVLHKGELREIGTHQELLARRGLYFKLYQLQYKEQEAAAGARD